MKELPVPVARRPARRLLLVLGLLAAYAGGTAALFASLAPREERATAAHPPKRDVTLEGDRFQVGGEPFHVRAVGWDPARPAELPWTRRHDPAVVEDDFRRIRAAGFNTLRTWAALSAEELAAAERHGLRVLMGLWTPPDGDFVDPAMRRRILAEVRRAVETARWSPAILGYLVMNEPRAAAVARAGLGATRAFLAEVAATARALDPGAPIGFASWPGMEALDDPLFDFVAFNLYPHRPRVVMDELGLLGYLRHLREQVARGRPLLVSEFGISVSPLAIDGRGGAREPEQAAGLRELAARFAEAGVAGTVVFQWNDGWWKNGEASGDEQHHDVSDPEEWFGLVAFRGPSDRTGAARPALAAMAALNRATLLEPRSGAVSGPAAPVRVDTAEALTIRARVDGGAAVTIPLDRQGRQLTGSLPLPAPPARIHVELELVAPDGALLRREGRLLRVGGREASLTLAPARRVVPPGARVTLRVRASGRDAGTSVSVAAYTEDRHHEERRSVRLASGGGQVSFVAPPEETVLAVVAFEDDPSLPPAERAVAFAAVEVRR